MCQPKHSNARDRWSETCPKPLPTNGIRKQGRRAEQPRAAASASRKWAPRWRLRCKEGRGLSKGCPLAIRGVRHARMALAGDVAEMAVACGGGGVWALRTGASCGMQCADTRATGGVGVRGGGSNAGRVSSRRRGRLSSRRRCQGPSSLDAVRNYGTGRPLAVCGYRLTCG